MTMDAIYLRRAWEACRFLRVPRPRELGPARSGPLSWGVTTLAMWLRAVLLRLRFNRRHAAHPGFLKVSAHDVELTRYRMSEGSIGVEPVWTFRWENVIRILAFKRDLFAIDQICLVFGLSDDTSVETNEEMIGFAQLIQELPRRFVGMDREWFDKVAQPPFESRPTVGVAGAGPAHEDAP